MSEQRSELLLPSTLVDFAENVAYALKSQIQMALAEIDQIHRVQRGVRLKVVEQSKRRENGCYDPLCVTISISRNAPDPVGTFLHEYGHFIDNQILQSLRNEYASRYELELQPLMTACWESKPVQQLQNILDMRRKLLTRDERSYLREALEPYEVFARAYAQWVCAHSMNFLLRSSLERRISFSVLFASKPVRLQWEPGEFADIMVQMNRLLHRKGLT